jgi:hypothetical protein
MLRNFDSRARETDGPEACFQNPDLRCLTQLKKCRGIFEEGHPYVPDSMALNETQFWANHHQDPMKNIGIPALSVDAIISGI